MSETRRLGVLQLLVAGVACLAGAANARLTGEVVHLPQGFQFRTHQDAMLVLLVVGVALVAGAVTAGLVGSERDA